MKKYNYVYKITNLYPEDSRMYYIGVRSSTIEPHLDVNYWSSSKYLKNDIKQYGVDRFSKEILSIWSTREEAVLEEIRLHEEYNVSINPKFYNKTNSKSVGFSPMGRVTVKNKITNVNESVTIEEYRANPHYMTHTEGTILVLDNSDNKTKRIKLEDFKNDNTDRYSSYFENQIMVMDLESNKNKFVSRKEFENNLNLVGVNKDKITVFDLELHKTKNISYDIFEKNKDRYKFILSEKIVALDNNGNTVWVEKSEFKKRTDLVGKNTNKVVVKNKKTGKRELISRDLFYSTDDFEALSAGGIMVRNKKTGKCKRMTKVEFDQNKDLYEGINKGYSNAFDIISRTMKRVSVEEFANDDNLINSCSNYYRIFDESGCEQYLKFGNIDQWCKENGFPLNAFQKSAKNEGSKIFEKTNICQERIILKRNWDKFRNWFVIKGKVVDLVEKNVK